MPAVLTLGPLVFSDFEIPEKINFGGEQMLVVKKLVGGDRVVDAMGRDDDDIAWSGRFRSGQAEARAALLDSLRVQGQQLILSWSTRLFRVVIRSFKADFNQFYEIPYSIACTVLEDLSSPRLQAAPSIDAAVSSDVSAAVEINTGIAAVTAAVAGVSGSLGGIVSFQSATAPQISGVQTALAASLTVIDGQIAPRNAILATSGGLAAGQSPQIAATALLGQSTALTELNQLYQVRALMGRTAINVANAGS